MMPRPAHSIKVLLSLVHLIVEADLPIHWKVKRNTKADPDTLSWQHVRMSQGNLQIEMIVCNPSKSYKQTVPYCAKGNAAFRVNSRKS
jgi:hypothetical protein